jgi:N-methylhydantoinase A/acetone carboxylase, beta subunit
VKRISIDTGGTFTDCLLLDESGTIRQFKSPTTPAALEEGVLNVIGRAALALGQSTEQLLAQVEFIIHGTTLASNLLLTGQGAKTGLITTKGFRDVIEIRRGMRPGDPSLFNQFIPPYHALVPRNLRLGVTERTLVDGSVLTPLDEDEVRTAATRLGGHQVESVAIGFLHSYANPTHERRAADICREVLPEAHVVLSHEILPIMREFERFSTTVVSAYVGPATERYVTSLERRLAERGFTGTLLMVTASGVVQSVTECLGQAVQLLGSGPAAAPSAANQVAKSIGQQHVISTDMGGTSFDLCLIKDGQIPATTESWFGEERVAIKVVDVHSIGAGGGSIAWCDPMGMLRVGPRSAGSDPGPACYGRGNDEPTVTDSDVFLGYLPTDELLGGQITLDKELARQALGRLGQKLDLTPAEAAQAILATVNEIMALSIREISTRRGHDLRDFALIVGGGAGPAHAVFLAQALGLSRVVVPRTAGLYSAFGMLVMDLGRDYVRAFLSSARLADPNAINALIDEMTAGATATMARMGMLPERVAYTRTADMRYVRQFHEVEIPLPDGPVTDATLTAAVASFNRRHEELYGFSVPDREVEFLALRLRATVSGLSLGLPTETSVGTDASEARKQSRLCWFGGQEMLTAIYDGAKLRSGHRVDGPAIVEEPSTTLVLPPGSHCEVHPSQNYVIDVEAPTGLESPGEPLAV